MAISLIVALADEDGMTGARTKHPGNHTKLALRGHGSSINTPTENQIGYSSLSLSISKVRHSLSSAFEHIA